MNERENNAFDSPFGIGSIIENSGKIIAVITLVVAALVTFTEVSLSAAFTESFTCQMIIMLLSSYLMYFSMEETGERRGVTSEAFVESLTRYEGLCRRVSACKIPALRDFLKRYCEEDRKYRQGLFLMRYGLSLSELSEYEGGAVIRGEALRVMKRAAKIRPVRLSPHALLNNESFKGKSELSSPEGQKLLSMLLRLVPTTVCTIFTVSVILTAKDGLSASSVIEGILKIAALPIIGFKGYAAGYKYARGAKRAYLDTKSRIIEEFITEEKL